ncbi:MAG: transporter substrate-binding domain-containing protein [Candidatus Kerfeldbacteria bacterium]|nr:transporter substrate-binding domain-containing protein [Candidatus Kerfeldbacteria bacterium]
MHKVYRYVLGLCVVGIIVLSVNALTHRTQSTEDLSDTIIKSGTLRVGYMVYPPLLMKDTSTGALSGISYDILEAAAKKLSLKTEWVEEVGWGAAIEGVKTGRYDIVGTQMWRNSARAREGAFTDSPMDSVVYTYVRPGDTRFDVTLDILNSDQYTISTLDGEMSTFIAQEDFPHAHTASLPQLSSFAEVLLNVVNNKADVAFVEPSVAKDFLTTHPGALERVSDTPVRQFGNSFVFARRENSMVAMFNIALEELKNNGTINTILESYNASDVYIVR